MASSVFPGCAPVRGACESVGDDVGLSVGDDVGLSVGDDVGLEVGDDSGVGLFCAGELAAGQGVGEAPALFCGPPAPCLAAPERPWDGDPEPDNWEPVPFGPPIPFCWPGFELLVW